MLNAIDYAALSPLLILLGASLVLLLIESFWENAAKKLSFPIAIICILGALWAAYEAPASQNSLLTPWLNFDATAKFFTMFLLKIGFATCLLSAAFFKRFEATQGEYYFLLISALFGLILIGISADFLTLFLGLETLSISLYILCGYMKGWIISRESSLKYFLMGALAAAFLLYGIALIYGATGTTRLNALLDAYHQLSDPQSKLLFYSGITLITLGFAFKAAIVPFHVWAPDVYDGAPTPVTAFMAVATKVGAFAALTRVFLIALPHFSEVWNEGISILAYPTLIYANYVALRQKQLRRFFAYSGISHAGFLLFPFAAETPDSLGALFFYLCIYAVATLGCFAILAYLDQDSDGATMEDLRGLFQRSPLLAGIFSLCLLTLAGIPPTPGFFAKFYIFKIAFEAGYYTLVVVGLLVAILSAYYYLRMVSLMLSKAPEKTPSISENVWTAGIVGIVSFVTLIVLSIYPAFLSELLKPYLK